MLRERLRNDLFACGAGGMPQNAFIQGRHFVLRRTFKHDFFAATGLYVCGDGRQPKEVVLKIGRVQPFFGLPLAWLGRWLKQREVRVLSHLQPLCFVPQLLGDYGRNGFAYRFIAGRSLDEKPALPDTFFDDLKGLLHNVHKKGVCYVDFNKRGNILLGDDGKPYLIDFQISLRLDRPFCKRLRKLFEREDYYHLLKHKRRLRPDLMSDSERQLSKRRSVAIRLHRLLTVPLRTLRRRLLGLLYRKGVLTRDKTFAPTAENDPSRFSK